MIANKLKQTLLRAASQLVPVQEAHAHCDFPCGIYDPHMAQIGALTVIRMIDLINEQVKTHTEHNAEFMNSMTRAVNIKEEHAEIVKREVRVIWSDYIKTEHMQKFPELTELIHTIMQLGSKSRQTVDREVGKKLLDAVNHFAEIYWETKGLKTYKAKSPYKPEEEVVYPDLKV